MAQFNSIDVPGHGTPSATALPARATTAKSRWWIWVLVIAVALAGWWYFHSRSAAQQSSSAAASAGKGSGAAGGAGFVVPVVVATAQRGDLPVYLNGLGTVTAFNTVTVRSRIDGQLLRVAFKEGEFVHQGDLLAEIDPRPYQVQLEQAEGQLAKDTAQRKDAEVNFERYKVLFQEGVTAKQQVDTQQALVGQFDGAIRTDQGQIDNAKLQVNYCRITAPISGRIGFRLVDAGNMVHAADTNGLLVITQLQPISVIFSLPQDQLPQVHDKMHSGAPLVVDAFDRDDTAKIARGKLASVDNQIDPTTGTYKLKAIFSNEDNALFPNQFVNMHLLVDTKRNLIVVPAAAIQRGPQGTYVYAVVKDPASKEAAAKIVPVTIAQTTGDSVGLSAGLNLDDSVVVDGQDKLQDGTKIRPTPATPANPAVSGAAPPDAGQNPPPGSPKKARSGGAAK